MNTKQTALASIILLILGGVGYGLVNSNKVAPTSDNNTIGDNQDKVTNQGNYLQLTVLANRCRGCGKCTKIDPEHFEMNTNTRKAMVISSTNLGSKNLAIAINNCPDRAISLK